MDTIFYIEDESDTALLVGSMLEREGFRVTHAADGRQARSLIARMPPPSLVLLDLVVPYASGFELLSLIRRTPGWTDVPVIVVSADSYWPDIERALVMGATDFLLKSVGVHGLVRNVAGRLVPTASQTRKEDAGACRRKGSRARRPDRVRQKGRAR